MNYNEDTRNIISLLVNLVGRYSRNKDDKFAWIILKEPACSGGFYHIWAKKIPPGGGIGFIAPVKRSATGFGSQPRAVCLG